MPTLLVVEDNSDIADLMRLVLHLGQYDVVTVPHGAAALAWLEEHSAAAVISDLSMPVLDGWGLHEALVHDPRYHNLPLLLTSTMDVSQQELGERGCVFLPKPFAPAALLAAVQRLLDPIADKMPESTTPG